MSVEIIKRDLGTRQSANTAIAFCLQVITDRGLIDQRIRINSEKQFVKQFGQPKTLSALEAYEASKRGVKLDVYRVGHYTDITSLASKTGTKATATIGTAPNEIEWEAVEVGTGYNGIKIDVKTPVSRISGNVDIWVTLPEYPTEPLMINDIPAVLSAEVQANLNSKLEYVQLTSTTGTLAVGNTATFAGGVFDNTTIVDADIIGNATAKNGVYAFKFSDPTTTRLINVVSSTHDVALAYGVRGTQYKKTADTFLPIGISATNAIHFANATGVYSSENIIDDPTIGLILGGVDEPHPYRADQPNYKRYGAAEYMEAVAFKDQFVGEWRAIGEEQFALKMTKLVTDYSDDLQDLYQAGIMVFALRNKSFKCTGDRTSLKDLTKNFAYRGIFDLSLVMDRFLENLGLGFEEVPNTLDLLRRPMWQRGTPFMAELVQRGAIQSFDPNTDWQGDQNVADDKLVVNADSAPRTYKLNITIRPVNSTQNIIITHSYITL